MKKNKALHGATTTQAANKSPRDFSANQSKDSNSSLLGKAVAVAAGFRRGAPLPGNGMCNAQSSPISTSPYSKAAGFNKYLFKQPAQIDSSSSISI